MLTKISNRLWQALSRFNTIHQYNWQFGCGLFVWGPPCIRNINLCGAPCKPSPCVHSE